MKILYLYDRMKVDGEPYIYAKKFANFLDTNTFIDYRYAIVSDEFSDRFDTSEPAFLELIKTSDFFTAGYNIIIQSGRLFEDGLCRIDENTLEAFWKKGGMTLFFWDISAFVFGDFNQIENRLERMRQLLGKGQHALVSIYTPPGEGNYIKGVQGQSNWVKINVTDEYKDNFKDDVKKLYSDVTVLVVEEPIQLVPYCQWLCIGDHTTWMVNSLDLASNCPKPFVFSGISFGYGICATITGHFANDYVLEHDRNDNVTFLWNLLNYFSTWQTESRMKVGKPTIFISYSHTDKLRVDTICGRLESAGILIWRDEKQILVAQAISRAVEDGIRKSDYFLLVLSTNSVKSAWVEMEYRTALTVALKRKKLGMIIPVVFDNISVEDVSLFLKDRKYADCSNFEDGIRQILEVVGK